MDVSISSSVILQALPHILVVLLSLLMSKALYIMYNFST
jgi:hypothetical protein